MTNNANINMSAIFISMNCYAIIDQQDWIRQTNSTGTGTGRYMYVVHVYRMRRLHNTHMRHASFG